MGRSGQGAATFVVTINQETSGVKKPLHRFVTANAARLAGRGAVSKTRNARNAFPHLIPPPKPAVRQNMAAANDPTCSGTGFTVTGEAAAQFARETCAVLQGSCGAILIF